MVHPIVFAFATLLMKVSVEGACANTCSKLAVPNTKVVTSSPFLQEVIAPQQQIIRSSVQAPRVSQQYQRDIIQTYPRQQEIIVSAPSRACSQQIVGTPAPVIKQTIAPSNYGDYLVNAPTYGNWAPVVTEVVPNYAQSVRATAPVLNTCGSVFTETIAPNYAQTFVEPLTQFVDAPWKSSWGVQETFVPNNCGPYYY